MTPETAGAAGSFLCPFLDCQQKKKKLLVWIEEMGKDVYFLVFTAPYGLQQQLYICMMNSRVQMDVLKKNSENSGLVCD